ncbi:MAG: UDP-3-O-acyl-N-acetylglucosamine deacetylase [bacterium]
MSKQTTISKSVTVSGIGLHTGNMTTVEFRPADQNTGIVFVRDDLPGKPTIPASINQVLGVIRGTTLGNGIATVHTVEHILAVCNGLQVDNCFIHLDSNEPPVGDGSAMPFVEAIEKAGIRELDAERKIFYIETMIRYQSGETIIEAKPINTGSLKISYTIVYDAHPVISRQQASFVITPDVFKREIAPARTFCFDYEIEALKRNNLVKGGSLDNAVVIGIDRIHCKGNLRFPDEFVRHKILDFIGDIFLLSCSFQADITAIKSGHGHNINFAKQAAPSLKQKSTGDKEENVNTRTLKGIEGKLLGLSEIQAIIPHRFPFLMIDRVKIIKELQTAVGYKYVSGNEQFFQGHFPGKPVMPGVLMIEAMAQTACVLFLSRPDLKNKLAFFMGIDKVKFRKPVEPGVVLELKVDVLRARERGGKVRGEAFVDGVLVSEAEIIFAIVDKE